MQWFVARGLAVSLTYLRLAALRRVKAVAGQATAGVAPWPQAHMQM